MKIQYSVVSEMGLRDEMEDFFCLASLAEYGQDNFLAAVFDGHCGDFTARYSAEEFVGMFCKNLRTYKSPSRAFKKSFRDLSNSSLYRSNSGACALAVYFDGKRLHYANTGDCELVIFGKKGFKSIAPKHRIGEVKETERIRRLGSEVCDGAVWRNGVRGLRVSRSLGDRLFKSLGVIHNPWCGSRPCRPESKFVLGTDGLFDYMSYEQIGKFLSEEPSVHESGQKMSDLLKTYARDNFTFILVSFE
jgi:serine/threonine protein phosphatase PrpC